ncbi:MAG: host attachment protein [Alphaproteobacteria bacterium]|nr:host attachment protein [Alphaproteobacteria bacterium]
MAYQFPPPRTRTTWIIVANGKRMRAYEGQLTDATPSMGGTSKHDYRVERLRWVLHPLKAIDMAAESVSDFQIGHDRRGSLFGYTAAQRHTVEPHLDVREEVKENFAHSIAARLYEAQRDNAFDRLVVIAPQRMLGELKRSFDPSLSKRVAAEIPKDLTRCRSDELLDYVRDLLPPAHVVRNGGTDEAVFQQPARGGKRTGQKSF